LIASMRISLHFCAVASSINLHFFADLFSGGFGGPLEQSASAGKLLWAGFRFFFDRLIFRCS
jgi:hypothetical protein